MQTIPPFVSRGLRAGVWAWLTGLVPVMALASPLLRCQFEVNAEAQQHAFAPTRDPYPVTSIDLNQRFRFKAVVLGDDQRVELINLYVYYHTRRQPMLMQHVKFVAPVAQQTPAPDALTGQMAVYSPFLGKELQYSCALHEVTP
ncbi:hypothetical protein [Limnohabitans sp. JirII-29]|uniref:hypothetical protein n=1 Tax=Limnohabitans sp. JirII-29 TaxID=1835756 RepID=UPI0011B244FA|nr:hypothetical protein [Limnohabitans sp. JirII-29]